MKKMFFFAAVAGVAFASCTKDVDVPVNNVVNDEEAIVFQLGNPLSVSVTRGQGGVGGTVDEGNAWNGEALNVYMFEEGTMNLAQNETTGVSYFENAEVTAPVGLASDVATDVRGPQYFPSSGDFDFFAYHGDDAVYDEDGNRVEPTLNGAGDAFTVPVTINGTQDLMVAKAALNGDDEQIIANYDQAHPDKTFDRDHIYSAYAARRGVHPRLTFKHLLSRFVFQAVISNIGNDKENLFITGIEVKAPSTGIMTVAALDENALGVVFDQDNVIPMSLKSRTVGADGSFTMNPELGEVKLTEGSFDPETNVTRLGESLLLPAGADAYTVKISLAQYKNGLNKAPEVNTIEKDIKLVDKSFEAGYQYKVNITVYGLEDIVLTADLEPWKKGEDVEVDGE